MSAWPYWGGWGGPRVVNNVVINRTTTVNVTNINVYRNVNVTNAVVGVPADRFGQGAVRPVRLTDAGEAQRLTPVRGAVDVRPGAASVTGSATAAATRPPDAIRARPVVATRAPVDTTPGLREQGLPAAAAATAPQPQPADRARARASDSGRGRDLDARLDLDTGRSHASPGRRPRARRGRPRHAR